MERNFKKLNEIHFLKVYIKICQLEIGKSITSSTICAVIYLVIFQVFCKEKKVSNILLS